MTIEHRQPTEVEARIILIAAWLAKLNDLFATYGKGLEDRPTIFDQFIDALGDIPVNELDAAFQEWQRIGSKFPCPADLRELSRKRQEAIDQYDAEKAFDHVRWMLHFFNYDPESGMKPLCVSKDVHLTPRIEESTTKQDFNGGWLLHPKPFDRRTLFAVEGVGGLERLRTLPPGSEFDFARRNFLQAFRRHAETAGYTQIGREEAKALIEKLKELK